MYITQMNPRYSPVCHFAISASLVEQISSAPIRAPLSFTQQTSVENLLHVSLDVRGAQYIKINETSPTHYVRVNLGRWKPFNRLVCDSEIVSFLQKYPQGSDIYTFPLIIRIFVNLHIIIYIQIYLSQRCLEIRLSVSLGHRLLQE